MVYKSNFYVVSFYVKNVFDRVDGTEIICQNFKAKCTSNDVRQKRQAETTRGDLVFSEKYYAYEHFCQFYARGRLHEHFFQLLVVT